VKSLNHRHKSREARGLKLSHDIFSPLIFFQPPSHWTPPISFWSITVFIALLTFTTLHLVFFKRKILLAINYFSKVLCWVCVVEAPSFQSITKFYALFARNQNRIKVSTHHGWVFKKEKKQTSWYPKTCTITLMHRLELNL